MEGGRRATSSGSARTAGGQRPQPRPERAAAALDASGSPTARRRRTSSARCRSCSRESLDEGAWGYSTGLEYAQEQAATEGEVDELCASPARPLYATHTRTARRGRRGGGRRGDPDGDARRGAAPGLASRPAERDRGEPPLHGARRRRPGAGPDVAFDMHTRRFGLDAPVRRAARRGRSPRSPAARGAAARPGGARRMRPHRSILSAGNDWGAHRAARQPVLAASTRAATWPRSPPSAARSRSTRSTTCCSAALDDAAPADGDHPRLHARRSSGRRSPIRSASRAPTRRRSRPTARSPSALFHGAYTWAAWFWRFMVRDQRLLDAGGGRPQADRAAGRPARPLRPRRAAGGRARRRRRLRPGALRRARHHLRAEPARRGHAARARERVPTLEDGRMTGERAGEVLRR